MSSIFRGFKKIHLVQILGTIKTDIHHEFQVQVGKVGEKVMITKHPLIHMQDLAAALGCRVRALTHIKATNEHAAWWTGRVYWMVSA